MRKIVPLTYLTHKSKTWKEGANYSFTKSDMFVQLNASEMSIAHQKMPIGFLKNSDGSFMLVGIQGVENGCNLLVDAAGNWRGRYLPEIYSFHPFLMAKSGNSEETALCVDEGSGLVLDEKIVLAEDTHRFFESKSRLDESVHNIRNKLAAYLKQTELTNTICEKLQECTLLKPWDIFWSSDDGSRSIEGIYCIDEPMLTSLKGSELTVLRDIGALVVVYAQLFSLHHMQELISVSAKFNARTQDKDIELDLSDDNTLLSFDNL